MEHNSYTQISNSIHIRSYIFFPSEATNRHLKSQGVIQERMINASGHTPSDVEMSHSQVVDRCTKTTLTQFPRVANLICPLRFIIETAHSAIGGTNK